MPRFLRPATVMLALLLAAAGVQAQWVWKDNRGQVHASDLPPPRDVAAKDILSRPDTAQRKPAATPAAPPASAASGPAAAPAAAKPRVDSELEARRKRQEQEQADTKKAEDDKLAAQRAENCQRARSHLANMESGQRVVRVNSSGEREFLDEKGIASEAARARQVIASDCK